MGRQEKCRSVEFPPRNFIFRPEIIDEVSSPDTFVYMRLDEFEAIRLADKLGYGHTQASEIMGISRPTFTRLLNRARAKAAEFIVDGKSLEISGGSILFSEDVYCCKNCHRPFKWNNGGNPVCPICSQINIIPARGDCNGDCRCCEDESL
ncbi:MAG: DUF134 domain-containing protein [Spirochaetales bacterium]|nr:DUF134 domain-containing protein [Spirochaetales bacterium]